MSTRITAERVCELLRGDFASDAHQTSVGNLEAGAISAGAYIYGTPGDFALTEAAPEIAEPVANMHYEYAVQLWTDGVGWETVCVFDTHAQAESYAKPRRSDACRVARRLAADWESAE